MGLAGVGAVSSRVHVQVKLCKASTPRFVWVTVLISKNFRPTDYWCLLIGAARHIQPTILSLGVTDPFLDERGDKSVPERKRQSMLPFDQIH